MQNTQRVLKILFKIGPYTYFILKYRTLLACTCRPITADFRYPANDVNAVRVEGNAEEGIQQEQLSHDVEEIEELDSQVGEDEIIATVTATRPTDDAS